MNRAPNPRDVLLRMDAMTRKICNITMETDDVDVIWKCSKSMNEVTKSMTRFAKNCTVIANAMKDEEEEGKYNFQANCVYDIMPLEAALQNMKERFKDELYKIDDHLNDIDTVKKVDEIMRQHFGKESKQWPKPQSIYHESFNQYEKQEYDDENLRIFEEKMEEVKEKQRLEQEKQSSDDELTIDSNSIKEGEISSQTKETLHETEEKPDETKEDSNKTKEEQGFIPDSTLGISNYYGNAQGRAGYAEGMP